MTRGNRRIISGNLSQRSARSVRPICVTLKTGLEAAPSVQPKHARIASAGELVARRSPIPRRRICRRTWAGRGDLGGHRAGEVLGVAAIDAAASAVAELVVRFPSKVRPAATEDRTEAVIDSFAAIGAYAPSIEASRLVIEASAVATTACGRRVRARTGATSSVSERLSRRRRRSFFDSRWRSCSFVAFSASDSPSVIYRP